MTGSEILDLVGLVAIAAGSVMSLTTAIGLHRLPDIFGRQHAASKPQILGLLLTLVGIGLRLRAVPEWSMLALVAFFQLITVPASGHLLTRAAYRGYVVPAPSPDSAPATGPDLETPAGPGTGSPTGSDAGSPAGSDTAPDRRSDPGSPRRP